MTLIPTSNWPFVNQNTERHRMNPLQCRSVWAGFLALSLGFLTLPTAIAGAAALAPDGQLRIICFGAHPDDCELQAGGVAALWSAKGHKVKFVSVTNGDIDH